MARKANNLWFVKFEHATNFERIVFNFTLPHDSSRALAFEHGRAMIAPEYEREFRDVEATIVCHTHDTVLCFEPC